MLARMPMTVTTIINSISVKPRDARLAIRQNVKYCTSASQGLFPLDRRRRLRGDVVSHTIDAAHFVDDAVRDPGEQLVRQRGPVGGHEIGRLHCAQGDDVLIRAPIAHYTDGAYRQEPRERLRRLVVPAGSAQLVDEYCIGALQQLDVRFLDRAQDSHAESRAGKRMAKHHLARQTECQAELAHLVLEELAQRLEELEMQRLRQSANGMGGLYRLRFLGF